MSWSRRNFAPVLFLSIDGKDASDLLRITTKFSHKVSQKKAAETKFVMRNDDRNLLDDPRTFPNKVWQFRYGYFNDMSPIIYGIVREVAPEYSDKRIVTFTLYDVSLNISHGSGSKNWGLVPSSEIAKKIAQANGMTFVVDDSNDKPKKAFIQPGSVNDLQYLRDLAANIDYEVFVDGSPPRLYYRKKPYDAQPHRVLTYYDDPSEYAYVKSFKPKVKSLGALASGVSGADGKNAKSQQGKDPALAGYVQLDGNSGDATNVPGKPAKELDSFGEQSFDPVTKTRYGVTTVEHVTPASRSKDAVSKPAPSGSNALALAAAARSQLLDKANEAESEHPLTPSIVSGRIYMWAGIEKQVNGRWYAEETESEIDGKDSSTKVKWKRNAKGTGTDKNKNQNNKDPKESDKSFLGWEPGTNTYGDFVDHTGKSGQKLMNIDGDSGDQKFNNYITTEK